MFRVNRVQCRLLADRRIGRRRSASVFACAGWLAWALAIPACRPVAPAPPTQSAPAAATVSTQHPHVVLISLCSVRADHLGCYGYPRDTSPHIDALAAAGVMFEAAQTPWPKTMPSFCSVMTGLWPHQTGVMRTTALGQRISDEIETLAERCRAAGYRTAAFTTTPGVGRSTNLQQGFDVYEETWRDAPGRPLNERRLATPRLGLEWLGQHGGKASLLWVHFNNAHYPYDPTPALRDRYVGDRWYDATVALPLRRKNETLNVELPANHPASMPVRRPDLGGIHDLAWTAEAQRARDRMAQRDLYVARYDAAIRTADEQVGIVLEGLRAAIGDAPCLVVLWSDHGESMGEHNYYFEHGRFAYESCAHVPFVMRYEPRWPQGRRVAQPVSTVDLAATVCELVGAAGSGLAGVRLAGVIDRRGQRGDVYSCGGYHWDFITTVRRGPWKLHDIPNPLDQRMMQNAPRELYDLASDPRETRNVAAENPAIVESLQASLNQWRSSWWREATRPRAGRATDGDAALRRNLKNLGYASD